MYCFTTALIARSGLPVSGGGRGYRSRGGDRRELLKRNSPSSARRQSIPRWPLRSVLMNFIEWSSGVQAESNRAQLGRRRKRKEKKKSFSFILLMSEISSAANLVPGCFADSRPPPAPPHPNLPDCCPVFCHSVGAWKRFNFAKLGDTEPICVRNKFEAIKSSGHHSRGVGKVVSCFLFSFSLRGRKLHFLKTREHKRCAVIQ